MLFYQRFLRHQATKLGIVVFLFLTIASKLNGHQLSNQNFHKNQPIDSIKNGFGKAKIVMYFKKKWDLRNAIISIKFNCTEKNSESLKLPKNLVDYQLVFEDQFDSFNSTIWFKGQPWGRFHPDNAHQFYGDPQVYVANGCLHLLNQAAPFPILLESQSPEYRQRILKAKAETNKIYPNLIKIGAVDSQGKLLTNTETEPKKDPISMEIDGQMPKDSLQKEAVIIPYSVGVVNTFHSKCFTHGFFAIRSKNPHGPATWPAWWLTGKNNWPPEIDIFEMYGGKSGDGIHTQTMTIHTGKVETHTKQMLMKKIHLTENTDSAFHIYACLWTPRRIEFFTDGARVKSIKLNKWMAQFYQEPMFLVLNNALENRFIPQLIQNGNQTSDFQVDWVKVYQQTLSK